jgi:hypothetical protein
MLLMNLKSRNNGTKGWNKLPKGMKIVKRLGRSMNGSIRCLKKSCRFCQSS